MNKEENFYLLWSFIKICGDYWVSYSGYRGNILGVMLWVGIIFMLIGRV